MAGYAVSARVDRPRLRAGGLVTPPAPDRGRRAEAFEDRLQDGAVPRPTMAERWADAQRIWAQTTFYLFDPESWR